VLHIALGIILFVVTIGRYTYPEKSSWSESLYLHFVFFLA